MNYGRAAIISENTRLARFFELELVGMGYEVSNIKRDVPVTDVFELMIVDADTVHNIRGIYSCPVIYVSSSERSDMLSEEYFIFWPASLEELRLLLGRIANGGAPVKPRYSGSGATVLVTDRSGFVISLDNRQIKLSQNEFIILERLCASRGTVVARRDIMDMLGADDGNISDVYICRLRKKLETASGKRLIFTERGVGYRTELLMSE